MPPVPTELTCVHCGKTFIAAKLAGKEGNRYCSGRCRANAWYKQHAPKHTGICVQCGGPAKFPHKLCSAECRTVWQRLHTSVTMGTYTCQMCGRTVERPANDARRQRYCSLSCRTRARAKDVVIPTLDPAFGYWLAGLADGEGCFAIPLTGRHIHCIFSINLRRDDRAILERIQQTLGFGRLYDRRPSQTTRNTRPQTTYAASTVKDCIAIAAIFRQFPLQAKKAKDFAVWAEAVDYLAAGGNDLNVMANFALRLKEARIYHDPEPPTF